MRLNINKLEKVLRKSLEKSLWESYKHIRTSDFSSFNQELADYKKIREQFRIQIRKENKLGKIFCWHSWVFLYTNFSIGDKFQCKKCQKIKYRIY
jgi:hypothetical protein